MSNKSHLKMDVNNLLDLKNVKSSSGQHIFLKNQLINHSYFKSSTIKILPTNSYASTSHILGIDMDFTLPKNKNMITQ